MSVANTQTPKIPAPFRAVWSSIDLRGYRPSPATYAGYPLDTLPPLDESLFTGDFAWHSAPGPVLEDRAAEMTRLAAELSEAGLALPADFVTYMTRADLEGCLDKVSCTACWTHLSAALPSPIEPDARMVCFFRDQQDCLLWYLYLRPNGESFIVHTSRNLEYEAAVRAEGDAEKIAQLDALNDDPYEEIFWCAPSTEIFAYRTWIENTLWFALVDKVPLGELTVAHRAYLRHYGPVDEPEDAAR